MTNWEVATLEILGTFQRGRSRHRPRNDPKLFGDSMPFFQTGDVKASILHMTGASAHYSEFGVSQSRVWEPGVACITIAANIAETAVLGELGCFPDSVVGFIPSELPSDSYFVKYLLDHHRARLTSAARGTTQDNLSLEKLLTQQFAIPNVRTRLRIVDILRPIDDLIENNRRRIEVLEEMAQAIYREWFVHFRYPGHEDATFVDSPLGPIPEDWEVRPLAELATVVRGRSYRKYELAVEGGLPFVNLKCMMRGGGFRIDGLKRYTGDYKSQQVVGHGDIVLAVTDLTQGREILAQATLVPRLAEEKGVISLDVARIVPKSENERLPLFFSLRCSDFADRVKEYANGSTVLHLSPKFVEQNDLIWPESSLRHTFGELAEPMIMILDDLRDSAERLTSIRDLLLPKLVTGEIDVSGLDLDALVEAAS